VRVRRRPEDLVHIGGNKRRAPTKLVARGAGDTAGRVTERLHENRKLSLTIQHAERAYGGAAH
jgi:hypothetical protein